MNRRPVTTFLTSEEFAEVKRLARANRRSVAGQVAHMVVTALQAAATEQRPQAA